MESGFFNLANGMQIPAVGMGVGTIKNLRSRGKVYIAAKFLKEKTKDVLIKNHRENNRYPVLKDVKKEKMIPDVIRTKIQAGGEYSYLIQRAPTNLAKACWGNR